LDPDYIALNIVFSLYAKIEKNGLSH